MARSKVSHFRRRGQKVRFKKKPQQTFFRKANPFDHNRLINEIQHAENQMRDKQLSRKPDQTHHKWQAEEEILEKENKKPVIKKKRNKI